MTALNTVKYFKDLGLEFVMGDIINPDNEMTESWAWFKYANILDDLDSWPIRVLAWRTNTGEKPAFNGMVEIDTGNDKRTAFPPAFKYWWTDGTIIKWRPLLKNQPEILTETPEEKEALDRVNTTKDSAPVKFLNERAGSYMHIMKKEKENEIRNGAIYITGRWEDEDLISKGFGQNPKDRTHFMATNPKPVFTKAMSDAGELPQVGCEVIMQECYAPKNGNNGFVAGEHEGEKVYITSLFTDRRGQNMASYMAVDGRFGGVGAAIAFRPIDTRTDKEKADDKMRESLEDGKAYQFESKSRGEAITVEGVYSDSGSVFITVHGSFPKDVCTNIQPLTVG